VARRRPLDSELVRRGLAEDLDSAGSLVAKGSVTVGGAPTDNPKRMVDTGEALTVVAPPPRFVSRGGFKLAAALDRFAIDPTGCRGVDVGSSTGGFTDCLLQCGAAEVVAIDVGRNQLHERLRSDPRVHVHERTNVRQVEVESLGGPGDLLVADLSFISLRAVVDSLMALTKPGGAMVLLVKPQFESRKADADRGRGVITDPLVWRESLDRVCSSLRAAGAAIMGAMVSPIKGGEGNIEFLVHVGVGADIDPDPSKLCESAVSQARSM